PEADAAQPSQFWGRAATATAAGALLSTYLTDQPPKIVYDPPVSEQQAFIEREAAVTIQLTDPPIEEFLQPDQRPYQEHLAACQAAHQDLTAVDPELLLAERAEELNAAHPPLHPADHLGAASCLTGDWLGSVRTVHWVPTRLIVATGHKRWG